MPLPVNKKEHNRNQVWCLHDRRGRKRHPSQIVLREKTRPELHKRPSRCLDRVGILDAMVTTLRAKKSHLQIGTFLLAGFPHGHNLTFGSNTNILLRLRRRLEGWATASV